MALLRTMLVFMVMFTFVMSFTGMSQTPLTSLITSTGTCDTNATIVNSDGTITHKDTSITFICKLQSNMNMIVGAGFLASSILILGLITFPNPYVIFAPLAIVFLSALTFPVELLQADGFGLPAEIRVLFIILFETFYILGVIDFFKGGET